MPERSLRIPCSTDPSRSDDSSSINRARSSNARPALSRRLEIEVAFAGHLQERNLALPRAVDQMLERCLPQAAWRNVDDAREGKVVLAVDEQAQVRDDVLHLLPFVERHSADNLMGNPAGAEGLLERTSERRHAAEDRDIAQPVLAFAVPFPRSARRSTPPRRFRVRRA